MDRERKNRISTSQKDNGPFLKASHKRHASESTNTDSAGSPGSYVPTHPAYAALVNSKGKIKYREQGVDELLQLKLHQALAAAESVPPGSTIVLATGDGNIGQFNEEGFLGTYLAYTDIALEILTWYKALSVQPSNTDGKSNCMLGRKVSVRLRGCLLPSVLYS